MGCAVNQSAKEPSVSGTWDFGHYKIQLNQANKKSFEWHLDKYSFQTSYIELDLPSFSKETKLKFEDTIIEVGCKGINTRYDVSINGERRPFDSMKEFALPANAKAYIILQLQSILPCTDASVSYSASLFETHTR